MLKQDFMLPLLECHSNLRKSKEELQVWLLCCSRRDLYSSQAWTMEMQAAPLGWRRSAR
jgi:hypothetical protein